MGLNGLRSLLRHRPELHLAFRELRTLRGARCDPNEHTPLAVRGHLVADDLARGEVRGAVEDLHGLRVPDQIPVVYSTGSDETNLALVDPLPQHNLALHDVLFEFGLGLEVVDLDLFYPFGEGFHCEDHARGVHDDRVGRHGATLGDAGVGEIHDGKLLFIRLADTDVLARLHRDRGEGHVLLGDARVDELRWGQGRGWQGQGLKENVSMGRLRISYYE